MPKFQLVPIKRIKRNKNSIMIWPGKKFGLVACFFILLILLFDLPSYCQKSKVNTVADTISKKEKRKEAKKEINLKPRFRLNIGGVYSFLDTYIRFETPDNVLGVKISLEDNLGLVNSKSLVVSSLTCRITRRSGIYASYYGLNRNTTYTMNKDIPYLDELIPQGSEINAYFNTQVGTLGYLYSILTKQEAFLGAYLNVYLMTLKTGVHSNEINLNKEITLLAPLPNIGLVMYFKMYKWLGLGANIGAFYLNTDGLSGKLYNFNVDLTFTATRWLGFSLGYTTFNIQVNFPEQNYNTEIGYNFRGPSAGVFFKF